MLLLLLTAGTLQCLAPANSPRQLSFWFSWMGESSNLRCLRMAEASEPLTFGSELDVLAPSSLSTDSPPVDGPSSDESKERAPEELLEESWLERREKSRDKSRRVERRPSGSALSGAGLGGRVASCLAKGAVYQELEE